MSELEKWSKAHDDVVTINEFLEWLNGKGIQLCEYEEDEWSTRFWPTTKSHSQLLEEYFDIDPVKLEHERREMLASAVMLDEVATVSKMKGVKVDDT